MWTHPHPFQDGSHIFPEKRGLNVAELLHLQSYGISFLPQEFYSARHILENESPFSRYRTRCLLGHDSAMEKYFSSLAEGRRQSPSSSSPCSSSSALGPLKAFCATKQVQRLVSANLCGKSKESEQNNANIPNNPTQTKSLKFGIHRILSEDFGKSDEESIERNTKNRRKSPSPDHRVSYVDPCGCGVCKYNLQSRFFPSPSLSAVHALQPPSYPLPQSIDSLPGPYAVLNDDGSCSGQSKRKRSWSRAVFSNLQRKGLEKRFEVQKYVTKPDRRQLAAMLGLTDAQVKVWFQNRRMKWRHAQQQLQAESGDSSDRSETKSVVENNTPMEMKDGLLEQDEHFVDLQETNDDDMDSTCSSPMETEKCHFEFGTGSPHSEEVDNLA